MKTYLSPISHEKVFESKEYIKILLKISYSSGLNFIEAIKKL